MQTDWAVQFVPPFAGAMYLYVIEMYKEVFPDTKGSRLTERLILYCLEKHGVFHAEVRRTEKGKPYVVSAAGKPDEEEHQEIYISVSHSGDVFVCLIADTPVGVDIQKKQKVGFQQLSRRYFTEDEQSYVERHGEDGFFFLWTRKEAYSKLSGTGLEEIMKGAEVLDRQDVKFIDFMLEDGMQGSCCFRKHAVHELTIRKL